MDAGAIDTTTGPHVRISLDDLALDDDARARLADLHDHIAPRLPRIADRLLDMLRPAGAAADDLERARFRELVVEWMRSGLIGPYDASFRASRARVCRRFLEGDLLQGSVFASLVAIRGEYRRRIGQHYRTEEAWHVLAAVDQLLDVELSLLLGFTQQRERSPKPRDVLAERLLALRTLTTGLAHEVRNPLNAAKLQLEVLERRLRRELDDARFYEPSELARTEIEKLSDLLDELLTFANPAALDLAHHDIVAIAHDVIDLERPAAAARGIVLAFAGVSHAVAEVDAGKIKLILKHLLANAIEAIERDGVIRVVVRAFADRVQLEVLDDGPGIPTDVRPRICEPFFSTHSGTGLGMSIVHSMVALHGGTIDVESEPGSTAVSITFPRRAR